MQEFLFLNKDFLLKTETARILYHEYAAKKPIIDYHCHVSPKEIYEDKKFDNISQVWLGGDHYKWRLMRANGVEEAFVTGSAGDREKFQAFAETLPRAVGSPVYQWTHLELRRYFNCDLIINGENAETIWNTCNAVLSGGLTVRNMIRQANVTTICTTDDPADTLEWHEKLRGEADWGTKVYPAFRPDKAVNIEKSDFPDYIQQLASVAKISINSLPDLFSALTKRIDFFHELGCRAADHGLDYIPFREKSAGKIEEIFKKAIRKEPLSVKESDAYKTAVLQFCAGEYAKRGWVMQLHYGAIRNANTLHFEKLGADTGNDCVSTRDGSAALVKLLDSIEKNGGLPKTVLYSLNPNDNTMLTTIAGCFANKIQHGSAWWFNDTKIGMETQLKNLASTGLLGSFIGMLTDSRSFLSYTRHEYFRRVLCNLIGDWVQNGEFPADINSLGKIAGDISYDNAMNYFGF